MRVVEDALGPEALPCPTVVTIGNYDGIHRGQRFVLDRVVARAGALRLPAVVVTFEPHPLTVLAPDQAPARLSTREEKRRLMADAGIDLMAIIRFTPAFAGTRAEDFVRAFLVGKLGVRELYVGRRFAFGRNREGDLELLARLGEELGFEVYGLDEEHFGEHPVSSTRIRQAIARGAVEHAAELLGRTYSLSGRVIEGDRLGRRLGWPTVNLLTEGELLPLEGVYATQVGFPDDREPGRRYDSVTNVGRRPTVSGSRRAVVESHIFDFDREVYGERIELFFHKRLRDEMLFPSVTELSAQIGRDALASREYFSHLRRSHGSME